MLACGVICLGANNKMRSTFLNAHEIIILFTVLEILFLCLILLLWPRKRKQPNYLLAVFFLLVAGTLIATLVIWNEYLQAGPVAQSSLVPALLMFCLLMQGPALYAYLRSLSEDLVLWHWRSAMHLIPAVAVASIMLALNVRVYDWLPWNWPHIPESKHTVIFWIWRFFKAWPIVYVLACIWAERQLRRQIGQAHSDISSWQLRWADIIVAGFFIHSFWSFTAFQLSDYVSGQANHLLGVANNYFTVLLINGLFLVALFSGRKLLLKSGLWSGTSGSDSIGNMEQKLAQIEAAIADKSVYLNSQVNLERFAEICGLKARDVSFILNRHYGKNFFEFINQLRVEEVKRLLRSDQRMTILDIAQAAGFNSQSAFQRFFKRVVGEPPSQYRRRVMAEAERDQKPAEAGH